MGSKPTWRSLSPPPPAPSLPHPQPCHPPGCSTMASRGGPKQQQQEQQWGLGQLAGKEGRQLVGRKKQQLQRILGWQAIRQLLNLSRCGGLVRGNSSSYRGAWAGQQAGQWVAAELQLVNGQSAGGWERGRDGGREGEKQWQARVSSGWRRQGLGQPISGQQVGSGSSDGGPLPFSLPCAPPAENF